MIKQVDRYVGKAAVLGILAIWVGLTLLLLMFNLLDELRSVRGNYGTDDVFWFVMLTTPRAAHMVFPVSALLGALAGVGALAAANELVAFRTSGVSRLRLAGAALAGTMLITALAVVIGEWIAPAAEQQARAFRLSEISGQVIIGGPRGMWMRDGRDIVNIQLPVLTADREQQSVSFRNVVVYSFADETGLRQITRATRAMHDGDRWILDDVNRVTLGEEAVLPTHIERAPWESRVRPELLDSAVTRPRYMSVRSLWNHMEYLQANGQDDRVYRSAFWSKIAFPFSALALVLAGMPFVFGSARHHGMGVRIFIGMTLGGVFTILSRALQKLGDAYELPTLISHFAPALLLVAVAVLVLRRSV